jgi:hypothetical protein
MDRHIGKIHISGKFLEEEHIGDTRMVLGYLQLVPYRAEFLLSSGMLEIEGSSPYFEELDVGDTVPVYDMAVNSGVVEGKPAVISVEVTKE